MCGFQESLASLPDFLRASYGLQCHLIYEVAAGCNYIQGANVEARDLRGGAALVIAALSAIGDTVISGVGHIDRGYEHIEETFAGLGAAIKRI